MLKKLGATFFCILILSCKSPFSPTIPLDTLLSAPEQIEIYGRICTLETYLWRDFMPGPNTPPDGKPLIALIRIIAIDLLPFPSTIDANRLWVINGQEAWETEFSDEEIPTSPNRKHQLEKIARNGPKWGPGKQENGN